jgi:uncharacterized protein
MAQVSLASINEFMARRRLALVGVSRDSKAFSRALMREFIAKGYDVVPVNRSGGDIEGRTAATSVCQVSPAVETALLMTPAAETRAAVEDCAQAGVKFVWMYRATGKGAVDPQAAAWCRERGIEVVEGECPLMFLQGGAWYHHVHGFVKKIVGAYPKK